MQMEPPSPRISLTPNTRRRRGSRQRGKTARSRKRAWLQFSRWNADHSDDDADFLHFCRTNGLARSSSAPTLKASARMEIPKQNKGATASEKNEQKQEETTEESNYVSSLCSFLRDKSKFIRESIYVYNETHPDVESKKNEDQPKEGGLNQLTASTSKPLIPRTLIEKQLAAKTAQYLVNTNSKHNRNATVRDNTNNNITEKPGLQTDNEKTAEIKESLLGHASLARMAQSGKVGSTTSEKKQSGWEWNGLIEEDLIKLYESEGAGTSMPSSRVVEWSQPQNRLHRKMSSSEQTPSYVLALANLFRKRVQIRNEISQFVSGQIEEVELLGPSMNPPSTKAYTLPQQPIKTSIPKSTRANKNQSAVSLRYHHSPYGGASHTRASSLGVEPIHRSSLQSLMGTAQAQSVSIFAEENASYQHLSITSAGELKHCKDIDVYRKEVATSWVLPASLSRQESNLAANLEELLAVFPKPPQSKFDGLFSPQKPQTFLNRTKNSASSSSKIEDLTQKHMSQEKKRCTTSNSLTASINATLRRANKQASIVNKSSGKRCHSIVKTSEINTSKMSALPAQAKVSRSQIKPPCTNILRSLEVEKIFSSSHGFSLSQSQACDSELSFLPKENARWLGSLGTLYKANTKEFSPDSNKLENSLDDKAKMLESSIFAAMKIPEKDDNDLMYPADQPLMASSPLDSLSAFVA